MNSYKIQSLLNRLKVLLTSDDAGQSTDKALSSLDDSLNTNTHNTDSNTENFDKVASDRENSDSYTAKPNNLASRSPFISDESKPSSKPITDAVLDYLTSNELSYHYHHAQNANQNTNQGIELASPNLASQVQTDPSINQVHHISMAMSLNTNSDSQPDSRPEDRTSIEWGCIICIHEHTQLLAIYGALPFHLPESHLNAGLRLATQLNYDMILGNIEIDLRDGEVRFKNALDIEPIVHSNNGIIPSAVINYLLKSVIAMTSSIMPLFIELINNDPEKIELQTLLQQHHTTTTNDGYFVITDTLQ